MDSHTWTSVGGCRGGTEDILKHGHPRTLPVGSQEDNHFPLVSMEENILAGKTLSTGRSGMAGANCSCGQVLRLAFSQALSQDQQGQGCAPAFPSHLDPRSVMASSLHRPRLVAAMATPGETNSTSEDQGSVH